jgi:transposase
VYVRTRRVKRGERTYEYVDIVESQRRQGRVVQRSLGTLGRKDLLKPETVDGLIGHLQKLASPSGRRGLRVGEMRMLKVKEFGPIWACRQLWRELGLDQLLASLRQSARVPLEEAIFRLVSNRLVDPQSKLAVSEWQEQVEWPSGKPALAYEQLLRAMDLIHPRRQEIEDAVFTKVTELFSLPLSLVFYDLTSVYFEGDGVSPLAEYGYSRDHRDDRAQVVVGLAVTQEGLPITHRVYPGNTGDPLTFLPMVRELKERFGLPDAVIVADRGMFSAANIEGLEQSGVKYVLALRARQQLEGHAALALADRAGLPRPTEENAPWELREVSLRRGVRHVVVYSAYKAIHDRLVRARRLQRTRNDLRLLQARAAKLKRRTIIERATRILAEHKTTQYFGYLAGDGGLSFWLERSHYRRQRRHDGIFILQTNDARLSAEEIVRSYMQLQEVERAFRVLKSLVKVRPIFHWAERRVEAHIFICFLAYLLAKALELKLRAEPATSQLSVGKALDRLATWKAVDYRWQDFLITEVSEPQDSLKPVLKALGQNLLNPVLRTAPAPAA